MESDLQALYAVFERCRAWARAQLAPVRPELVEWLRAFIKKRKPQSGARELNFMSVDFQTDRPAWCLEWQPGNGRSWQFRPAAPYPALDFTGFAAALGLNDTYFAYLRSCLLFDLIIDAWEEAGGFTFVLPLAYARTVYTGPDVPRDFVTLTREAIARVARAAPPRQNPTPVPEPPAARLAAHAQLLDAARAGAPGALEAWADAFAVTAPDVAALLRWVPAFRAAIEPEVRAVAPEAGFALVVHRGHASWVIGDCDSEVDNADARNLYRLLTEWADFHPAVEWLFRALGLPRVTVELVCVAGNVPQLPWPFELAAGEHFDAFEPGIGVVRLDAPPFGDGAE